MKKSHRNHCHSSKHRSRSKSPPSKKKCPPINITINMPPTQCPPQCPPQCPSQCPPQCPSEQSHKCDGKSEHQLLCDALSNLLLMFQFEKEITLIKKVILQILDTIKFMREVKSLKKKKCNIDDIIPITSLQFKEPVTVNNKQFFDIVDVQIKLNLVPGLIFIVESLPNNQFRIYRLDGDHLIFKPSMTTTFQSWYLYADFTMFENWYKYLTQEDVHWKREILVEIVSQLMVMASSCHCS